MPYQIQYSPEAFEHLQDLPARQQRLVLDSVDEQLSHQPSVETRNRKPLRPNPMASWELRIGDLRVYYDVQETPKTMVFVRAVGVKRRNRVFIGGEEFEL